MKLTHYDQYRPEDTARAESALLTVWAALGDLTSDLVLVGGLVPRYICKPPTADVTAVTMDVDLGVSLELNTGQYEPTSRRLADHGFQWKNHRFVKTVRNVDLYLDFLTDKPTAQAANSVAVDDIAGISAVFGISRALEIHRTVTITGFDLQGARVTEHVKVCEAGPYLCLKLQAYAGRAQRKAPVGAGKEPHEQTGIHPRRIRAGAGGGDGAKAGADRDTAAVRHEPIPRRRIPVSPGPALCATADRRSLFVIVCKNGGYK